MTTTPTIDPIVHGAAVPPRMDEMQEWKVAAYLEKNARGAVKRQEMRRPKPYGGPARGGDGGARRWGRGS